MEAGHGTWVGVSRLADRRPRCGAPRRASLNRRGRSGGTVVGAERGGGGGGDVIA